VKQIYLQFSLESSWIYCSHWGSLGIFNVKLCRTLVAADGGSSITNAGGKKSGWYRWIAFAIISQVLILE
jgi:hypothetical protein